MAHPGRHRRAFHRRVSTQNRACDDPHTAPHLRRRSSARRRAPHPLAVLRARSRQGSRLIHDREHLDFDSPSSSTAMLVEVGLWLKGAK
jgi:hypothetical protein